MSNYSASNESGLRDILPPRMADPLEPFSPALGNLDAYLGYHLRRAHNRSLKRIDQALVKLQLTTAMYGVLELLSCNPELSQGRLATAVGLTNPSMVPLVDKLAERGLVERCRHEHDRRSVHLKLTPEGRRFWSRAARVVREHENHLRASLSDAEVAELIRLLGKVGG